MANHTRVNRVADLIQQVLAEALYREVSDPRLKLVSFSGVEVSRDLAHATVFVSVLGDATADQEAMKALQKANGFLRNYVAKHCQLRITPQLHFELDHSVREGQKMDALIAKATEKKRDE